MVHPVANGDPADDPSPAELIAARPHLRLHAMDGLLMEGVPLNRIADVVGTPTWVYSAGAMRTRYRRLIEAMRRAGLEVRPHYAVKANDHLAVLALFAQEGAGADVVSEGELRKARHAGIPARRIVFSGVGKSPRELRLALAEDIGQINVESAEELEMLSALAAAEGRTARVALRVNPDIDAGTHAKISTGRSHDKFGIPFDEAAALYARAAALPGIRPVGLAVHIGSQILSLAPYRDAFGRLAELVRTLRQRGLPVDSVDCGGGLGIPYRNEPAPGIDALAGAIRGVFHNLDLRLAVEAADAMAPRSPADVVGPVCETGDTFARSRLLPPLAPNARVAILDAGAYGAVMSSAYNARPHAAEVMVDGDDWAVIRERQSLAGLWSQ